MKKEHKIPSVFGYVLVWMACAFLFVACGDDDSFSPVARDRGYEYAYTSAKDLSKTPCDSMRKGREAAIGRDKDIYECIFDEQDSVYLWAGDYDTLTAVGREFHRAESSSSSRHSGLDPESSSSKGDGGSEAAMTSSSYSSSSRYSSSSYSSSSVRSSSSYSSSSGPRPVYSLGDEIALPASKDDFFNPDIDYGTMTDPRDGKVYRTVNVNGKTWMAENLNFSDSIDYPVLKQNMLCYNYKKEYCDIMGALYNRAAAMNDERCAFQKSCDLGSDAIQGICPDGWHIPSRFEVESLIEYVGDAKASTVRSVGGWTESIGGGSDLYGLSFVGTGNMEGSEFNSAGKYTHAWAYHRSTEQYYFLVQGAKNRLHLWIYGTKEMFVPVRCISNKVPASSSSAQSSSSVSSSSSSSESFLLMTVPFTLDSKEDLFNPDVEYGTLVDERDGQTYRTVAIGDAVWMAENLNFAGNEDYPILEDHSYCFNNEEKNCALLGRLYERAAAMNDLSCEFGKYCDLEKTIVRGACPEGWHIPTKDEALDLLDYFSDDYDAAKSTKGWNLAYAGTNTSGFSLVASGNLSVDEFVHVGEIAIVWFYTPGRDLEYLVHDARQKRFYDFVYDKDRQYVSIRCVKDQTELEE